MKVAIVGSRSFKDYSLLKLRVDLFANHVNITEIISGGAKGADTLAEQYANEHNIKLTVIPAEWDKYGKSAGYRRNVDIVNQCDYCIAFWDYKSKGTKHTIDLCKAKNIPCEVIRTEFNNG